MVLGKPQRGAVLIVAMVFMLIMTMLGISAFNSTTLEEKMAANMRDRMVALQAAEVALEAAQDYLEGISAVTAFGNGSNGLYSDNNEAWKTLDWNAGTAVEVSGVISEAAVSPKYIIEQGPVLTVEEESLNLSAGYGDDVGGGGPTVFTITAFGTGSSANSRAILQATYGKQL